MAPPGRRRALGALFFVLAALFAGIALAAASAALDDEAGIWVISVGAAAIALWLVGLAARAWRAR